MLFTQRVRVVGLSHHPPPAEAIIQFILCINVGTITCSRSPCDVLPVRFLDTSLPCTTHICLFALLPGTRLCMSPGLHDAAAAVGAAVEAVRRGLRPTMRTLMRTTMNRKTMSQDLCFWCWTPPRPQPVSGPQRIITSSGPSSSSTASNRHVLPHAEASAQSMRSEDWKLGNCAIDDVLE